MPKIHDLILQHLRTKHPKNGAIELMGIARSHIHHAIERARDALNRFAYHIAITQDRQTMVSAKLFGPGTTFERDFMATPDDLARAEGYPINFQISASDEKGVTIYASANNGSPRQIVSSKEAQEIEEAVYAELLAQVKAGIDTAKAPSSR